MSNYDTTRDFLHSSEYQAELALRRSFMTRVYGWMTVGLLVTAIAAFLTAQSGFLHKDRGIALILLVAYFGVYLAITFGVRYMSAMVLTVSYVIFAALLGVVCSDLLLVYTTASITSTFFITAGMFGGMSAFGILTKKDLSGMGSFLIMAFWGVLLASIVNIFVASSPLDWLLTYACVTIFTGLAAYHTQQISRQYADSPEGSAEQHKTAVYGALMLYITFINLFVSLLRILGSRRN